jgi:hypothetical protein
MSARRDFPVGLFCLIMRQYLDDMLFLSGAILITTGAGLIHPIAALFAAGGFCIIAGVLVARAQKAVEK